MGVQARFIPYPSGHWADSSTQKWGGALLLTAPFYRHAEAAEKGRSDILSILQEGTEAMEVELLKLF
jgi:hypothetical protein